MKANYRYQKYNWSRDFLSLEQVDHLQWKSEVHCDHFYLEWVGNQQGPTLSQIKKYPLAILRSKPMGIPDSIS